MNTFFSQLEARVEQTGSLLCVGLDPHPADLSEVSADAARSFCLRLVDACAHLAAAFKPNSAFFEVLGPQGTQALKDVISAVPAGIPVILDAKRGDIASTAEAYARAAFVTLGASAVTANPYLGYDSLQAFLADPQKGVFLLCKTSNPGSGDLQDLRLQPQIPGDPGLLVYEHLAVLAQGWNRSNNLGLVVGATHPDALARLRTLVPGMWFLTPGIGAQGGDLEVSLRAGLRADGMGMLLPVSRAISRTADPRRAAEKLRDEINRVRTTLKN